MDHFIDPSIRSGKLYYFLKNKKKWLANRVEVHKKCPIYEYKIINRI